MSALLPPNQQRRLKSLLGHEFFAAAEWRRRAALWLGGIGVGLATVGFVEASKAAFSGFLYMQALSPWLPLAVTPLVFALLAWFTNGPFKQTRGSGIPQVIAAIGSPDPNFGRDLLSLPVTIAKMALTLVALLAGASVGREGPSVQVGAGLMNWLGRRFGYSDPQQISRFVLAGGGAGIAAAFNTPLAGVVFAIEELAGAFEHRFSGIILTTVIFSGIVSLGLLGNYSYFGIVDVGLPLGSGWWAIVLCGVCGGIGGGLYSRSILLGDGAILKHVRALRTRWPVWFALACGLALVGLGFASGNTVYGTGYAEARGLLQGTQSAGASFGLYKLAANIVSQWAALPGGIFSPALAVGAGMGHTLAAWVPAAPTASVVLLGMAAFLAGVTQAPITAAVIALELTANHNLVVPLMAVCVLARGASALVCSAPVYHVFANRLVDEFTREKAKAEAAAAPAAETPPPDGDPQEKPSA